MKISPIDQYCIKHSSKESNALKEIREYTDKNELVPVMISGPLVVNTLKSLIKLTGASSVLEIGMFTGYSALGMAEALPENGKIHTCEIMDRHVNNASQFFKRSKHNHKISIHQGEALDCLETFKIASFDLIFIDADKKNYIEYYNRAIKLVRKGGVIVLDNMLWGGSVINPNDLESKTLSKLGKIINNDDRIFNILLTIRDGIMICIKQ